jgi:DNA polymerase/3'-5' exonuclease PolX
MPNEDLLISAALNAWTTNVERAEKFFGPLTAEQLLREVAPGKNRLIYLWGHLTAVHDAMLPLLGLGRRLHPEFDMAFVSNADRSQATIPAAEDVRKAWEEVSGKLAEGFAKYSAAEWLQKHAAVSAEDFAKQPHRNRFAVLVSRTNHLAYHLGQVALAPK